MENTSTMHDSIFSLSAMAHDFTSSPRNKVGFTWFTRSAFSKVLQFSV